MTKKKDSQRGQTTTKTKKNTGQPQTMADLLADTDYRLPFYQKGDKVTGTIIALSSNEILIDVGAKSYAQVGRKELEMIKYLLPSLKVGDQVSGTVILPENELGYMVVSLKNLGYEKKWELLEEKLKKEAEIEVKGVEVAKGGLLIDYAGIRGFIPAAQLDPAFVADPSKLKGKKIKVKILEVNKKNTRFVVSQKAVTQKELIDKQKKALDQFEIGKKYEARVTGVANFGIFVLVPAVKPKVEIEGLIHISEIAWEKVEDPNKYVKVGDQIEVVVIGIDKTSNRLNLSLKQLTPDPWKDIDKKYKPEQQVTGKISRLSGFGAFVNLENGVEGLIHISKIPPGENFKEGQKIQCVIEKVDPIKRKIALSFIPKAKPIGYR